MKPSIFLFFIIIPIYLSAQAVPPEKVIYEGEEYWRYEDQDTTYMAITPRWYAYHDSTGKYLGKSMKFPRDGKWICFYKQGGGEKVESIFHIKDSLYHGPVVCFDFQQRKREEYNFFRGQLHGYVRGYDEIGMLNIEHQYRYDKTADYSFGGFISGGLRIGTYRVWHDNGQLLSIIHYNNNGERHGPHISYYENGQIEEEAFYYEDKKDSIYTIYHSNGQIKLRWKYIKGAFLEDWYKEYHESGNLSGEGKMEEGRKIGPWTYYYENGQKKSEGSYGICGYHHEGIVYLAIKQGEWTYWHSNGQLMAVGSYEKLEYTTYHPGDSWPFIIADRAPNWQYYDLQGRPVTKEYLNERGIFIEDK